MIWILLIVLLVTLVYFKITKAYDHWTDRGIKQRNQTLSRFFSKANDAIDLLTNIYNTFPNERYFGIYQGPLPSLAIKDPELIKLITVKDFDHFIDRNNFVPEGVDPLWSRNLFSLKGDAWHDMRLTLSPSFTSSKMKMMFTLISECAGSFMEHMGEMEQETISVELKDAFTRYANDVIATSAFGIKCDSLKDRENEFYKMGKKATNLFGIRKFYTFFMFALLPKMSKVFGVTFFDKDVAEFFTKIITETIRTREENNATRRDMLQLLIEARKGKRKDEENEPDIVDAGFATVEESQLHTTRKVDEKKITDLDITAQALIFFFAGFDTISNTMCFMGHELTAHPEIQRKLREEVDGVFKERNGVLTYEALMKMRYMDMVVSETLRLWPTGPPLDRVCVKPYTIQPVGGNEKPVRLKVGDVVWIPAVGFHRDEKYFPNPEVFDPERFSDENKHKIRPYTYFPFGLGPRNCIGSRFALMEVKILFFHLLTKFELVPVEETQIPLKLKRSFILGAENGFWIGLKKRSVIL